MRINSTGVLIILLIILAVFTFLFSPGMIQSKNLKNAVKVKSQIDLIIKNDKRFNNIRVLVTTAELGMIDIFGDLKSQKDEKEFIEIVQKINKYNLKINFSITVD
jgi:hypothetical protein